MSRLRVAILGYMHESNSFAVGTTGDDAFEQRGILRGGEMRAHEGANTIVAGYLHAAAGLGVDVVPLLFAEALPSGPIASATYTWLRDTLVELLRVEGPWDAVLLALHGAAVAEGEPDADGAFVEAVRGAVGPEVPVGVTLDLHANVSERLVAASTVTVTYQTNPHLDAAARAAHCAEVTLAAARGDVRPVQALVRVPAVVNILRMSTDEQPMRGLVETAASLAASDGMLSASVVEGFPYADVPHLGMSCIAVHDGDVVEARSAAASLAEAVWGARDGFVGEALSPADAVAACAEGTTLLLDVGDNVGGGSTGDSVVLLREALAQNVGPVVQTIHDPAAVAACEAAGVGARLRLTVGGAFDPRYGGPVEVEATVRSITDGRWSDEGPVHGGANTFTAGATAEVTTQRGDVLLLTSLAAPPWSAGQYLSLGIDLRAFRIVVGKGVVAPRATFRPYTDRFLLVDTPGPTTASIEDLPYRHRPRVWPLDEIERWAPEDER